MLRNVTPQQMRTIQSLYYVPNNTALIVTGDVEPARVFALAERILGDWPRGDDPFVKAPIPEIPALTGDDAVIDEHPVSAVTRAAAVAGAEREHRSRRPPSRPTCSATRSTRPAPASARAWWTAASGRTSS